jgi:hypothetical protein
MAVCECFVSYPNERAYLEVFGSGLVAVLWVGETCQMFLILTRRCWLQYCTENLDQLKNSKTLNSEIQKCWSVLKLWGTGNVRERGCEEMEMLEKGAVRNWKFQRKGLWGEHLALRERKCHEVGINLYNLKFILTLPGSQHKMMDCTAVNLTVLNICSST